MTDAKFTPGPWDVYQTAILSGEVYQVFAPKSKSRHWIANVQIDAGKDGDGKANANLIAAAPDLYEALKAIVDCHEIGSTQEEFCEQVYDFIEEAKTALAKAEGREP
jgi:hypothetical protein